MARFVYNYAGEVKAYLSSADVVGGSIEPLLEVFEWDTSSTTTGQSYGKRFTIQVANLIQQRVSGLRVICAPLDLIDSEQLPERLPVLRALFEHLKIPSEFIHERLHSVTHSFGSYDESGRSSCWCHFLCKNIQIYFDPSGNRYIQDPYTPSPRRRQEDPTWLRSGIFLTWDRQEPSMTIPSNFISPQSACDHTTASNPSSQVTLVIFGAQAPLIRALNNLTSNPAWRDVMSDPIALFVPVLDSMFTLITETLFKMELAVKTQEQKVFEAAEDINTKQEFDFVSLHNVLKHLLNLHESAKATKSMADQIYSYHQEQTDISTDARTVQRLLRHKITLLEGCILRCDSSCTRMQDLIQLALHTVNQRDSHAIRADSQAMKVIALMTMLFLPVTAVATIYGSAFFDVDPSTGRVRAASNFHIFWAISLPLTTTILCLYIAWDSSQRGGGGPKKLLRSLRGTIGL